MLIKATYTSSIICKRKKKLINFRLSWYIKILNDTTKINKICDFHTSGEGRKRNRKKIQKVAKERKK